MERKSKRTGRVFNYLSKDDIIKKYQNGGEIKPDTYEDGGIYSNNYAKNNFFNRVFKRNQILEKQIMDEYPALYKIGKLKDFKVIEAEGKYKEHLQNTNRNPEYFSKGDTWFPYMDNMSQPLKLKHRNKYRTLVDDDNLSNEQLKEIIGLDYVSHAMRNDEVYNNMTLELQNKLYEKYDKDFIDNNGGVDAYIRGIISNSPEYEPYKKETEFLGEYRNQFVNYLKTKVYQNGGPIYSGGILPEVTITGDKDKVKYPYYKNLTPEQQSLFNSKSPIGRSLRSQAMTGQLPGDGMGLVKAMTAGPTAMALNAMNIPQALMVEMVERARGNPASLKDALNIFPQDVNNMFATGQRTPSQTFLQNAPGAVRLAGDIILDPANLVGAGVAGKAARPALSNHLRQSIYNSFVPMGYAYKDINSYKVKPFTIRGEVGRPSQFKSEIDWAKWNPDTPKYPELINEYNAIEESAKKAGTWMKNPDGSPFQGTPEQFIQQQSSWFKKAFPEGSENVFRGTGKNIAELRPNRSMFTANQELASSYAPFNKKLNFLNSESVEGGVHNFYRKNSKNSIELDANNTSWTSVDLSNRRVTRDYFERNIKSQEDQITKIKEYLSKMKQKPDGSWEAPDGTTYSNDLYKNTVSERELYLKNLKERYKNIDNLISNPKELEEMRKVLGDKTTTDDIAAYVETRNLDYVKLKNIEDSGAGDVTIVNHKPGNYLKSAIGNVGFFDMTNPNIYKGIIPPALLFYLQSQNQNKTEY